jgi:hypothetical protein
LLEERLRGYAISMSGGFFAGAHRISRPTGIVALSAGTKVAARDQK